jgi:hypothetical protein
VDCNNAAQIITLVNRTIETHARPLSERTGWAGELDQLARQGRESGQDGFFTFVLRLRAWLIDAQPDEHHPPLDDLHSAFGDFFRYRQAEEQDQPRETPIEDTLVRFVEARIWEEKLTFLIGASEALHGDEAHANRGNTNQAMGKSVEALADYGQALRIDPKLVRGWSQGNGHSAVTSQQGLSRDGLSASVTSTRTHSGTPRCTALGAFQRRPMDSVAEPESL